jgi:hypothetical protein
MVPPAEKLVCGASLSGRVFTGHAFGGAAPFLRNIPHKAVARAVAIHEPQVIALHHPFDMAVTHGLLGECSFVTSPKDPGICGGVSSLVKT